MMVTLNPGQIYEKWMAVDKVVYVSNEERHKLRLVLILRIYCKKYVYMIWSLRMK